MSNKKDNSSKVAGAVGTILVHLLLLLAIYFFGLRSVIPPEEDGLTVNYGNSETGEGLFEPAPLSAVEQELDQMASEAASVPDISTPSKQEMVAQETEESLEVKKQREAERKKEQERLAEQKRQRQIEEEKRRQEEEARKALEARAQKASSTTKNAFSGAGGKGTDTSAKSQGIAGGSGNQGKPDGDPNSTNYTGGGSGSGSGVSYSLGNRKALNPQKPPYNQNIEGYIVVEIEVNPQGKVISARAGAKGTTIGDATMRKIAEQTAYKTKFTGTTESNIQVGTITYLYKLN